MEWMEGVEWNGPEPRGRKWRNGRNGPGNFYVLRPCALGCFVAGRWPEGPAGLPDWGPDLATRGAQGLRIGIPLPSRISGNIYLFLQNFIPPLRYVQLTAIAEQEQLPGRAGQAAKPWAGLLSPSELLKQRCRGV